MVFDSFRIFFPDNTRVRIFLFLSRKARNCFPEFNIRLYDNNSESENQIIFFSFTKIRIFFYKKNTNPPPSPFKLNGRSLKR